MTTVHDKYIVRSNSPYYSFPSKQTWFFSKIGILILRKIFSKYSLQYRAVLRQYSSNNSKILEHEILQQEFSITFMSG